MIDYAIELERIELLDASVGGHLSWIQGTGGLDGDPKAKDQVEAIEQSTGWRGVFSANRFSELREVRITLRQADS